MRPLALALTTPIACAALALAACGGSGDGASAPLTRAQFIARTDVQCKASNLRTKALNEQVQQAQAQATGDADLLKRLSPILQRGYGPVRDNAAAFETSDPPPADATRIETLRKLYDHQAELVRMLAIAAKRGDVEQFNLLSTQQDDVVKRARRLARGYGFKECGSAKSDAT